MINTEVQKTTEVTTILSIRRKPGLVGLPGDDPINYNYKIGSAIKGVDALRGLSREEERLYLPQLINVSPEDTMHWFDSSRDYWSNISVFVPADEEVSDNALKGKVLKFVVSFKSSKIAEEYKFADLEQKAKIISNNGGIVVEGVANYVLYRYCLVYGRVANSFQDIYKSAKIRFYLYSRDQEIKREQAIFKKQTLATKAFFEIMEDEKMIDSILRISGKNPETFETLGEKHLEVDKFKVEQPSLFLDYVKDKDLVMKASIKKAVALNIIYNPVNTDSYYYGADNDILLGNSLLDAVLYLKSDDVKKKEVRESIVQQLKSYK